MASCDAQYADLGLRLDTRLVSEDKKLRHRFPQRVVSMSQLVESN